MALSHSTITVTETCSRTDSWPSLMIILTNFSAESWDALGVEPWQMRPMVSNMSMIPRGSSRPRIIFAFAKMDCLSITVTRSAISPPNTIVKN